MMAGHAIFASMQWSRTQIIRLLSRIKHFSPSAKFEISSCQLPAHFAALIESTWIVLALGSSVPLTVTFCAANCSGVCWSLNV
jgi:hypothetical protein